MTIHKPATLHSATGLARLLEDKLQLTSKPKTYYPIRSHYPNPTAVAVPTPSATSPATPSTPKPSSPATTGLLPTPPKPLPFHKLTPEAIQQRKREGLYFRCPARYFPGHQCSPPQFMIIIDNNDTDESLLPPATTDIGPTEFMSLSPAAFFGMSSPQTLRLTGYVLDTPVTVLIDCGSTHNIMQPRIASNSSISTRPTHPFPVMVRNGQFITCEGQCPSVPVTLDNASFDIAFYVFPIHGADIVLGISWLATLGRLSADFSIPEISFTHSSVTTTLRGEPVTRNSHDTTLASLQTHAPIPTFHSLLGQPTATPPSSPPTAADPSISALLQAFNHIFATPHHLPPPRPHDHHIPLRPVLPKTTVMHQTKY